MNTAVAANYQADPVSPQLRALYETNHIKVLWESQNGALPPSSEKIFIWPWATIRPIIFETAKITLPAIIERRVMGFANPTNANPAVEAIAGLLNAGVQALMPGEHARPHRHSMHALRLVLEGNGAETIVEGKPCPMEPGDLIVTPGWTWHEHRNVDGAPTVWVDILDAAMHRAFGTAAFQPGPIQNPGKSIPDAAFTSAAFVPVTAKDDPKPYSPVFRYPWADAVRAVDAAPAAADGSRMVRYADPLNGGPVLPTIDCYLQKIEEGAATRAYRSSASAIGVVLEGEGETHAGEDVVKWKKGDVFGLPQNRWTHHHCTNGPARLFIATNRELYRNAGLLTEEHAA